MYIQNVKYVPSYNVIVSPGHVTSYAWKYINSLRVELDVSMIHVHAKLLLKDK